jgi:hypothetical protein
MLVTVVATLCSLSHPDICMQLEINPPGFDEPIPMQSCMLGQPAMAKWISENRPGYRLAGWKCAIGKRAVKS